MELLQWANGKGYTLIAEEEEFELLKRTLNEQPHFMRELEVDESELEEV